VKPYNHTPYNKRMEGLQKPIIKTFRRIEIMHKFIKNCKKAEIESVKKKYRVRKT
jgi:hypothetical protein